MDAAVRPAAEADIGITPNIRVTNMSDANIFLVLAFLIIFVPPIRG
jgi:hypothetical protein